MPPLMGLLSPPRRQLCLSLSSTSSPMAAGWLFLLEGAARQILELWRRKGQDFQCEDILSVAFVPLIGEAGWRE